MGLAMAGGLAMGSAMGLWGSAMSSWGWGGGVRGGPVRRTPTPPSSFVAFNPPLGGRGVGSGCAVAVPRCDVELEQPSLPPDCSRSEVR